MAIHAGCPRHGRLIAHQNQLRARPSTLHTAICQLPRHSRQHQAPDSSKCKAAAASKGQDRTLTIKISLAKISGSLDLSWLGLQEVPEDIFELEDLEELTLAGNSLKSLPARIAQFKSLRRLQAAGNQISALPVTICQLTQLEEVWLHGNLLEGLPEDIGQLSQLQKLSLAGNRLNRLPESLGLLTQLREINLAGNLLEEVPDFIGNFEKLASLSLNGNQIKRVSPEIGRCASLRFLNLQTNSISELPEEIMQLKVLEELNVSDNELQAVPETWQGLEACTSIWLYGNRLSRLPSGILHLPSLECIWLEGNPLDRTSLGDILSESLRFRSPLREVGLDWQQVQGLGCDKEGRVWERVRLGEVPANSRGYFKLKSAAENDPAVSVLVVTFASAPGTPNWGGVLNRIASEAKPEEKRFDVLYVCDGGRNWYSAGDDGMLFWRNSLKDFTERYLRVVMLGDSMGATAALLFSDLATSVQVFTPQVDLSEASLRPGQPREWLGRVRQRIVDSVTASSASIDCHVGTWEHDLEQAKLLPESKCNLIVHHVDSHRLAFSLNQQRKLVPTIRAAILKELGLYQAPRLANLL